MEHPVSCPHENTKSFYPLQTRLRCSIILNCLILTSIHPPRNQQTIMAIKQVHSSPHFLISAFFSYSDIKNVIETDTFLQCGKKWNKMTNKIKEIKRTIGTTSLDLPCQHPKKI